MDGEFGAFLSRTEMDAGADPERINPLASWLSSHGFAQDALPWLESFPDDVRKTTPVRLAETECYLALGKWADLTMSLEHCNWDADEHLHHAILALAYRQQGNEQMAGIEWKRAVHAANSGVHAGSKSRLALVRLVGAWSWETESEHLLWDVAGQGPENRWATAVLRYAYEMGGDTWALMRVFQAMLRSDPGDVVAQNNLASVSLLLGTNLPAAHQLARQAYAAQPTNAAIASTYAYSMHLQGHTAEGLQVLSSLPPERVTNGSTAAYYGLLLSAQGAKAQAAKYLALARKAALLPEEKVLIERADNAEQ
jgi:tetratricopeptide (TPR) repeat protein